MKTKKQLTAVEWLYEEFTKTNYLTEDEFYMIFNQAKEMERKERLKYQLFIGKVDEIVGFDKTLELLKETSFEKTFMFTLLNRNYSQIERLFSFSNKYIRLLTSRILGYISHFSLYSINAWTGLRP